MPKSNVKFQEERRAKGLELYKSLIDPLNIDDLDTSTKQMNEGIDKGNVNLQEFEDDRILLKEHIDKYAVFKAFADLLDGKVEGVADSIKDIMYKSGCHQIGGLSYKQNKSSSPFDSKKAEKNIKDILTLLKQDIPDSEKVIKITDILSGSFYTSKEGAYKLTEIASDITEF